MEFLLDDPGFEDVALSYKPSLERIGIKVTIRTSIQRSSRTGCAISTMKSSPASSPRAFARQRTARILGFGRRRPQGQPQPIGIKNPVVDKIIDLIIFVEEPRRADRGDEGPRPRAVCGTTTWFPHFYRAENWYPHWNRFSYPEKNPDYSVGFPTLWWWDEEKAKRRRPINEMSGYPRAWRSAFSSLPACAEPRQGLSAFGDLNYPPDFTHFDYVNPDAPKGGRLATLGAYWRSIHSIPSTATS